MTLTVARLEQLEQLAARAFSSNAGPWQAALKEGAVPIIAGPKLAVAIAAAPGDAGRHAARYLAEIATVGPELLAALRVHLKERGDQPDA